MLEYVAIVDKGKVHRTNDDAALVDKNIITNGIYLGKSEYDYGLFL